LEEVAVAAIPWMTIYKLVLTASDGSEYLSRMILVI